MYGAVLSDDGACVDGYDFVIGEGSCEDACRLVVFVGLVVGGQDDGLVDCEEVGIGGGQAVAVGLFVDGIGEWQPHEPVGLPFSVAQGLHLLLEGLEVIVVLVARVVATGVEQQVARCHPDDGVDVAVGVVASEVSVVDPDDAVGVEAVFQFLFYLFARKRLVALHLALGGGHDGSSSVALDGSSLEHEVGVVFELAGEMAVGEEPSRDVVVVFGWELPAPAVELELQGDGAHASLAALEVAVGEGEEGECSVVACPCVVDVALAEGHPVHGAPGYGFPEAMEHVVGVLGGDDESFAHDDDLGELDEGVGDVVEIRGPVGCLVGPCELYGTLWIPFGGQDIAGCLHDCADLDGKDTIFLGVGSQKSRVFFIFALMKVEMKDGSVVAGGRRLFEGVSFVARGGEVVCIVGSRGSGKTSLLLALLGMWPLDVGVASFDGAVVTPRSAPYLRREVSYVPQDWPREAYGDLGELVEEALARECSVAVLDEPLTGADEGMRQTVLQAVRELTDRGVAVVMTLSDDDRLVSHVQGLSESQMRFNFVELWKYQSSESV